MFSKDSSFQVKIHSVTEAMRVALQQRSLDQPGVLVASIEDVLEEGTASMAAIGAGTTAVLGVGGTTDIDNRSYRYLFFCSLLFSPAPPAGSPDSSLVVFVVCGCGLFQQGD